MFALIRAFFKPCPYVNSGDPRGRLDVTQLRYNFIQKYGNQTKYPAYKLDEEEFIFIDEEKRVSKRPKNSLSTSTVLSYKTQTRVRLYRR